MNTKAAVSQESKKITGQEAQKTTDTVNAQSSQPTPTHNEQRGSQEWGTAEFITFGFARTPYPRHNMAA